MTEISVYEGGQPDLYRPQIMTPEAAKELDRQLQACVNAVLREGTDYGPLPGTDGKNVLFKSGAEKLLQWFGLSYSCERLEIDHDADGNREGVTYRATVAKRLPDGTLDIRATCDGYAGYDEDKFYQSAEQARARAEAKERHWAGIDGRRPNPNKWMNTTDYRAPWNTVIKMAQKRAMAGAVINATGGGGRFTADDDSSDAPAEDGPSWYQDALGAALILTTVEAGRELHRASAQAVLSGDITPKQATHVQNRIRQRVKQLESHVQADVTTYADDAAAAQDTSPAGSRQRPRTAEADAAPPAQPAGEAHSPVLITTGHQLDAQRQRLGYGETEQDWEQWLADLARIARLKTPIASPGELTQAEAKTVIDQLKKQTDRDALRRLLDDGEARDE